MILSQLPPSGVTALYLVCVGFVFSRVHFECSFELCVLCYAYAELAFVVLFCISLSSVALRFYKMSHHPRAVRCCWGHSRLASLQKRPYRYHRFSGKPMGAVSVFFTRAT